MKQKRSFFEKISAGLQEDSSCMKVVGCLLTLAAMNLAILLCGLPLITMGCGLTAFYSVRGQENCTFDISFLKLFREAKASFRRSLLPWLMVLLTAAGVGCAWYLALLLKKTDHFLLMLPLFLATALLLLTLVWLFPVLAMDRSLGGFPAIGQALLLGLKELPRSIPAMALEVLLLGLPLFCTTLTRVGLYLFFGIAPLCALKYRVIAPALCRQ